MKICFVTSIYPPNFLGGPGEVVFNLQKFFLDQGIESYVFTCGTTDEHYPYTIRSYGNKRIFPVISSFYYRKIKEYHFDILNFHGEGGMGLAPFFYFDKTSKIVTTLHSEILTESRSTKPLTFKGTTMGKLSMDEWFAKNILSLIKLTGSYMDLAVSDKIITVSEKTKDDFLKQNQISKNKISVIYNGVDCEKFNPEITGDKIREHYSFGDSPVILTIGGNIFLKGTIFALYALSEIQKIIPETKLVIVGVYGKNRDLLYSIIEKLGIQENTFLIGKVPNYKMPAYYSASDIVLIPSLSENFPVVALEAMASGKTVVASRVGGLPELIINNGILFSPGNVQQLTEALLRLLENPSLRKNMGYIGRKMAEEKYDWRKIGQLYLEQFKNLV